MPTRLRSRSLEPILQNAPLLVLPGDLIGKILGALLPTGDDPAAEHVKEGLKLAYAVCCTCKSLCKSVNGADMEPYWEALCKAMGPFVQQPFAHVKLLWPNVDGPNNAHDPCTGYGLRRVNNTRLPWKRTVGLALTLLARTPFQMRKPLHHSPVNQGLLSVYMLLHRAVAHVRTIGWPDGKQLILSVLGYCLFNANAVKFAWLRGRFRESVAAWYEKEVKPVLVLLSGLVPVALWQELSEASCRYVDGTSVQRTYAETADAKRLREILSLEWGGRYVAGEEDVYEAVKGLAELMRRGYDVSLDPAIVEITTPCLDSTYDYSSPGEEWSMAFLQVHEVMTANYGVRLTRLRDKTLELLCDTTHGDITDYLTCVICDENLDRLKRYLVHIPDPNDFATALEYAFTREEDEMVIEMVSSAHFSNAIVRFRLGKERADYMLLWGVWCLDEETIIFLARYFDFANVFDQCLDASEGLRFLEIVAKRFSIEALRTILEQAMIRRGKDVIQSWDYGYLYECAMHEKMYEHFELLVSLGLRVPKDSAVRMLRDAVNSGDESMLRFLASHLDVSLCFDLEHAANAPNHTAFLLFVARKFRLDVLRFILERGEQTGGVPLLELRGHDYLYKHAAVQGEYALFHMLIELGLPVSRSSESTIRLVEDRFGSVGHADLLRVIEGYVPPGKESAREHPTE